MKPSGGAISDPVPPEVARHRQLFPSEPPNRTAANGTTDPPYSCAVALASLNEFEAIDDPADEAGHMGVLGNVRLEWSTGDRVAGLPTQLLGATTDQIDYRCLVVAVNEAGTHLCSLPVVFFERVVAGDRSLVSGSDPSGSFRVRLEAQLPPTKLQIRFEYRPSELATPADLLPSIELLGALRGDNRLGLWSLVGQRWAAEPVLIPADVPNLPDGYASTVSVLARVQRLAGQTFPMPPEVTPGDADNIRRADQLLSGETVTGTWQHASVTVDQEGLEFFRSASEAHGALFEFVTDYSTDIAGHKIALGRARYRLLQVFLAETLMSPPGGSDASEVTVGLVPGGNDRFEITLVSHAEETRTERSAGDALEAHAGRWIAQDGDEIVEVGDTPTEVLEALRRHGRTGSVWRVPRSREEAEAILIGSL